MTENNTAIDQLKELDANYIEQKQKITAGAVAELREKRRALLDEVSAIDKKIASLTGKHISGGASSAGSKRVRVSIEQIADAIRGGATNYPTVARALGCSKINVMNKIKKEGQNVGIHSRGQKKNFELYIG